MAALSKRDEENIVAFVRLEKRTTISVVIELLHYIISCINNKKNFLAFVFFFYF